MDLPQNIETRPVTVVELKSFPADKPRPFDCVLSVRRINDRTARNGNPFIAVELGDRTGTFNIVCFADTEHYDFFKNLPADAVIRFHGQIAYYQDRFSPKVDRLEELSEREILDKNLMAHLVETPPEDPRELWEELQGYLAGIEPPALRQTAESVLTDMEDTFRKAPAAQAMHHAYQSGLLEHTVHMARAAQALLPIYKEVHPGLAMAGIILHDTGKVDEYTGTFGARRTRTGILQGHVVLGYRLARKAAMKAGLSDDLRERLEHIILSHQGELEWGAAAYAATPEAVFVSMVDNLDAKMGMVQRALRTTPEGEPFSDFLPGLNAPVLVEPIQE